MAVRVTVLVCALNNIASAGIPLKLFGGVRLHSVVSVYSRFELVDLEHILKM